jgi:hypothetical protein
LIVDISLPENLPARCFAHRLLETKATAEFSQ